MYNSKIGLQKVQTLWNCNSKSNLSKVCIGKQSGGPVARRDVSIPKYSFPRPNAASIISQANSEPC